jgi:predicted deacylase
MTDAASLITTDIDYDRDGLQTGTLRVPYSHNRSAYGHIPIPLTVAKRGSGPTVLLSGAVHGDEYEGPIALMRLMRALAQDGALDRLTGRLIVIPALNVPAYRAGTRVSPIDAVNLNRAFPGKRNGTPTELIAHYVETVLMRLADYALDFHAGGSSLDYLPTLFAEFPEDAKERAVMDKLIAAFGGARVMSMNLLGEDRVIGSCARRNGVPFLTGEFGGGATVDLEGLDLAETGLAGVLDMLGVLPRTGPKPPAQPMRRLAVQGAEHYIFAPCDGIFEPAFRLGDEIAAGQLAGLIHDPVQPWREPVAVHFKGSGLALCIRTFALCAAGDCLGHLAGDVSVA